MSGSFSEILRNVRETRKLSQSELAERAGLQPSAISHFETGKRAPSFENLVRLANALAVSIDFLLGRAEEPRSSGPLVDHLFQNFGQMSGEDQVSIVQFAAVLANKNVASSADSK